MLLGIAPNEEPILVNVRGETFRVTAEGIMRLAKCERCGKTDVDIHTCTPTESWRVGFKEAVHMVFNILENYAFDFGRCTDTDQICSVVKKGIEAELINYLKDK
jgi:hypothetical protein